jgi:hypothetical protein
LSDTAVFEPPLVDFFLGPSEWLGCLIVGGDESIDVLLQLLEGGEGSAAQRLALEDGKPSLDLIKPRRARRDEMEMDFWVFLEPTLVLLMGVEIVEDDVEFSIREGGNDIVHEAEELDTAAPLGMRRNDLSGGDFERCEQGS